MHKFLYHSKYTLHLMLGYVLARLFDMNTGDHPSKEPKTRRCPSKSKLVSVLGTILASPKPIVGNYSYKADLT